jgi:TatA/E family protein of Tat protein translocase
MFGLGHWEVLIVAFVAFLLFGHRLPSLLKSAGASLRGFREGMEQGAEEEAAPTRS